MIKFGVIGVGGIADKKWIPALKKVTGAKLEALMDTDEVKLKEIAVKYGIKKKYTKIEDILKDDEIDAVYIATPLDLHCEHVIQSADAGKHILCEKPMASTVEECKKMINTCNKNNVKFMLGYMMRFNPYHQKVKELVSSQKLGRILMAKVERTIWYPPSLGKTWRIYPKRSIGGVLADLGTHLIDLLRFLVGDEVIELRCLFENVMHKKVEDSAVLAMRFSKGCLGTINVHWNIPFNDNILQIYGTDGGVILQRTIGPFGGGKMELYKNSKVIRVNLPFKDPFQIEIEHFLECIRENRNPLIDGKEGLKDTQILIKSYEEEYPFSKKNTEWKI